MVAILATILTLVIMEGLLSADNALVLAIMVRKLKDPADQKKALFYGLWGAVAFRAICIFAWTWISKVWLIKVFGVFWLAKMTYDHFTKKDEADEDQDGMIDKYQNTLAHRVLRKFGLRLSDLWAVIISVEIMDIAFSVDSILAAFALSTKFIVLLLGGALGILMMRGVAGIFLKLIAKVPEFEDTAYVLIGIIAVKMALGTVHNVFNFFESIIGNTYRMHEIEVNDALFFGILVVTFLGTFVIHKFNKNKEVTHSA